MTGTSRTGDVQAGTTADRHGTHPADTDRPGTDRHSSDRPGPDRPGTAGAETEREQPAGSTTDPPGRTGKAVPGVPETTAEALELVLSATAPDTLFGPYDGTPEACLRAAGRVYRSLARLVHPDVTGQDSAARAQQAFTRLGDLWVRYQQDMTGVTGRQVVITTRRRTYSVGEPFARGDIAVLYKASYQQRDGSEGRALLKMPRSVADNDLMEREATALERIERQGDPAYSAYVPRLVESFRHRESSRGAERRVNVIARASGMVSLTEVRAAYPDGLDARDVAWMWRRLLVALGHAHRAGVVHGAVLPDHVLIQPRDHGLMLVDWCYSTTSAPRDPGDPPSGASRGPSAGGGASLPRITDHVPAMVDRFAAMYPHEVPGKLPPDEATDIHLATRCMQYLLAEDAPRAVQRFARGCTLPAQARRPHDAWRLLGELDELLGRLYGPRRFRPFSMPSRRT